MNSNVHIVPLRDIKPNELLDVLHDMGVPSARTTMPDIDHVSHVVRQTEDECQVVTSSIACSNERNILSVPTIIAQALVRGEPYAYDHVRSVLRAPFN